MEFQQENQITTQHLNADVVPIDDSSDEDDGSNKLQISNVTGVEEFADEHDVSYVEKEQSIPEGDISDLTGSLMGLKREKVEDI